MISTDAEVQKVPPEEVARRIEEYKRICWERGLPAQVVYSPPYVSCPWTGCDQRIAGIRFKIEEWVRGDDLERLLKQWWIGPGLAARCPGCGNYVLFSVTSKTKLAYPVPDNLLPDDWAQKAYVVCSTNSEKTNNGTQ
jgi:hypothetical protein